MSRGKNKRAQIDRLLDEFREHPDLPLQVAQVMTAAPITVRETTSALELIDMFYTMRFRHFLVTDASGQLSGVISDRNIRSCIRHDGQYSEDDLAKVSAADLMSSDLITVTPEATLLEANRLMLEHGVSCLPVVDQQRAVGILTGTDLHFLLEAILARLVAPAEPVA